MPIIFLLIVVVVQNVHFHAALMHIPEEGETEPSFLWFLVQGLLTAGLVALSMGAYIYEQNV
jgi:hypothetical protein